jgi:hypothetical protein
VSASRCLLLAVTYLVVTGCAPRVPLVPRGEHGDETPVAIPFPPPPARVEVLPAPPSDNALWRDGHWRWDETRFVWLPGRWVEPPRPGVVWAPPRTLRSKRGKLWYLGGHWHTPNAPRR